MSGAELITVLGAAASVIQICQSCAKIIRLIRDCQPTKFLQTLEPQVHLLKHDIEQLRNPDLSSPPHSSLDEVLFGCQRQLEQLSTLIQAYHESSNLSRSRRLLQAPKLAKSEKEIQKAWTVLREYKSTITLHLSIHTATRMLVATDSADGSFAFHVPFERNLGLVGRNDVFDMISDYTRNCNTWPCIIFLTGGPGIGKTQVAIELCYRSRNKFAKIAWIAAHSQDRLEHGVVDFAHALSKEQPGFSRPGDGLEYIKRLAENRKRPWLIVFDDCEFADIESDFLSFINDGRQRDLIVVTKRANTSRGIQIDIPPLSEEHATKLLLQDSLFSSMPNELEDIKAPYLRVGAPPFPFTPGKGVHRIEWHNCPRIPTAF